MKKVKAPRNKTITLTNKELDQFKKALKKINSPVTPNDLVNKIINDNFFDIIDFLPENFVDLLFIDPPYNINKNFNSNLFKKMDDNKYAECFESWFKKIIKILKPTASVYVCSDWRSTYIIQSIAKKYLIVRNRITWEREKGRGSKRNWKNCSEDILYCTVSNDYTFNVDAVKLKRRVLAPYRDENGNPKDWIIDDSESYRLTYPSNIWTDISVPFWSMPENTEHPTQKPEKLLAKIILASTNPGDFVFDPFLGSGTSAVVAKKLNRIYCGIEIDQYYSCLALKRLELAESDKSIQGFEYGVFWERNSFRKIKKKKINNHKNLN